MTGKSLISNEAEGKTKYRQKKKEKRGKVQWTKLSKEYDRKIIDQ